MKNLEGNSKQGRDLNKLLVFPDPDALDLLKKLFKIDPKKRLTAC